MLNQTLNFSWTIIGFFPVVYFWFLNGINWSFYVLLVICLISCFLPERAYRHLDISKDLRVYKRLGIKFIRRFAQDGDFNPNRALGIKAYLKKISMFERYHFCCLLLFQVSSVYACYEEKYLLAFAIFVCNLLYNVYPILLQQYNRIRITKLLRRHRIQ